MAEVPFSIPLPGGAGINKNFNLDVNGGLNAGFPGYPGEGGLPIPGFAGWGGPYIPTTPLGALGGVKGDLLIPIVIVGVAAFLLLIIVLAVKAALAFKIGLVEKALGTKAVLVGGALDHGPRIARDTEPMMSMDAMAEMTQMITSAIQSDCWSDRMACGVGKMAKEHTGFMGIMSRVFDAMELPSVSKTMTIIKLGAENDKPCDQLIDCKIPEPDEKKIQEEVEKTNFVNSTITGKI